MTGYTKVISHSDSGIAVGSPAAMADSGSLAPAELPGIFTAHELNPAGMEADERNNITPDWLFIVILCLLAVFAWLRINYSKYLGQMFQALLNSNLANQIVRDENILLQRASIFMGLSFNIILALFLYLVSLRLGWELGGMREGFFRFLFFFILIAGIYALRFLVLKICGWLFDQEREMAAYVFNIFLVNHFFGMALIPFILVLAYNPGVPISLLLLAPLLLAAIAFSWRIIRSAQLAAGIPSFSPLYLFLYLCTLEIAPLFALIRLVVP